MIHSDFVQDLQFEWLYKEADIPALVALFLKAADVNYISHSEIIEGRAHDVNTWAQDIEQVLYNDFHASLRANKTVTLPPSGSALCIMRTASEQDKILGFANLYFVDHGRHRICILSDIAIDPDCQGQGLGHALYRFVEGFCRSHSIGQIHLESGLNNHGAHRFFESRGFELISKNFMKRVL